MPLVSSESDGVGRKGSASALSEAGGDLIKLVNVDAVLANSRISTWIQATLQHRASAYRACHTKIR